jgi:1,4-alpha-glucan branching enzyme
LAQAKEGRKAQYKMQHPSRLTASAPTRRPFRPQIHVPTFATHTENLYGTFRSTAERLDYLVELGINGICLMPISQDVHPNPKEEFCCWG